MHLSFTLGKIFSNEHLQIYPNTEWMLNLADFVLGIITLCIFLRRTLFDKYLRSKDFFLLSLLTVLCFGFATFINASSSSLLVTKKKKVNLIEN